MNASEAILIVAVTALCTQLTRAIPFLLFGGKKRGARLCDISRGHTAAGDHGHTGFILCQEYRLDRVSVWSSGAFRHTCGSAASIYGNATTC